MGRPLKYKTVEELRARISDYFTYCAGELLKDDDGNAVTDKYGAPIRINVHAPTVTGLARFLGCDILPPPMQRIEAGASRSIHLMM